MHCDSTPPNYFAAALAPPKPQVGNCENRNMISPYPKPSATHSIIQWFGKIFDALCILEMVSADILALPSATLPTFFLRTLNLLCTASALLFWMFNLKRFRLWGTRDQIKSNLLKVLEIILILDCKMSPRPSNKSKQIFEGKCSHSPLASINSWGGGFPFQSLHTLDISGRTAYSSQECKQFHLVPSRFWMVLVVKTCCCAPWTSKVLNGW